MAKRMDRRRTAYHEAGHAVMAALVGVPLERVTIVQEEDNLGCAYALWDTDTVASIEDGMGLPRAVAEQHVMVTYAGPIAEKIVFGDVAKDHHWGDKDDLGALAFEIGPPEVAQPRLKELRALAESKLKSDIGRAALEVTAKELLSRDTLTGDEVAALVRAVHEGRHTD